MKNIEKIDLNINSIDFYLTTIHLFQRNDINLSNELLLFINKLKKDNSNESLLVKNVLNEVVEIKLDLIILEEFTNKLKNNNILEIFNEVKETFFLEDNRFKLYFSKNFKTKNDLEKRIDELVDINKLTKNNFSEEFLKFIYPLREEINKNNTGRNRLTLLKDSIEIINRSFKIDETLNKLDIKLTKESDYNFLMSVLSYELVKKYNNNNINENIKDIIQNIGEDIQKNSISFTTLKEGGISNNNNLIYKERQLKLFPKFVGKGSNIASDYIYRVKKTLRNFLLEKEKFKGRSYKIMTLKDRKKLQTLTKELSFKKDLRELLIKILEVHNIKVNKNSKSLFVDINDIKDIEFAIDKNILKSPLNITLSLEKKSNSELLDLILNIKNINKDNVIGFLNDYPEKKLKNIKNIIKLEKPNLKELDRLKTEIKNINITSTKVEKFQNKYGEFIGEFLEEEFIKIYNYSDFLKKNLNNIENIIKTNNLKDFFNSKNISYSKKSIKEIKEDFEKPIKNNNNNNKNNNIEKLFNK